MTAIRPTPRRRTAFTLIELLVVISIIAVLATLAILVAPRISERQKTANGASQLQGWLLIAKQRAYRDRVACGLQLVQQDVELAPDYPGRYVRRLRYVAQPDDFTLATFKPQTASRGQNIVRFVPDPMTPSVDFRNICNLNDYLVLASELHRITNMTADTLEVSPPLTADVFSWQSWRIVRRPRAIEGEEELQLPADVVIDLHPEWAGNPDPTTPVPVNTALVPSNLLVLFAPGGSVVQEGSNMGKYILYVRDSTLDSTLAGEPTLITVYTRTGAIAAHPVNPNGTNRYSFTQDGRSSGL